MANPTRPHPRKTTAKPGHILAALLLGGAVISLALFSIAIAAFLAILLAGGLAWQWGRALISGGMSGSSKRGSTRFDAYQQARRDQLARDQAAFDAEVARQRHAAASARFEAMRAESTAR